METNTEGRFMVAVGAIIEHPSSGNILVVKRSDTADFLPGTWETIYGRMKQFEEPESALKREIKEESGLNITVIKLLNIFHLFRGEKIAEKELVGITYWAQTDSDSVTLSSEHSAHQWVTPERALEIVQNEGIRGDIGRYMQEKSR